jgi:hypothetical protein
METAIDRKAKGDGQMAREVGGTSRLFLKTLFEDGIPAGLTDGQLLERFATSRGEPAELAFAILVERHGPMVLRACRGILRDDHEAMDAFQATFLIQPMWLSFAPGAQRFVTIESQRKAVTVWDAVTLNAVATLHPHGVDRVVAAGLSGDGKTVVMFRFSPDPSAELYDVTSGLNFATLRLPSSAVGDVFGEGGKQLNKDGLQKFAGQRDTHFWEVVQSLAPTAGKPNGSPAKP